MKQGKRCGAGGGKKHPGCLLHEPKVHGLLQAWMLISIREQPKHGYDILRVLEAELPPDMVPDRAVVYRMLRDLESGEYTASRLEEGHGGPARKVYSITPRGQGLLREWRGIISRRADMLARFMNRYDMLETTPSEEL